MSLRCLTTEPRSGARKKTTTSQVRSSTVWDNAVKQRLHHLEEEGMHGVRGG